MSSNNLENREEFIDTGEAWESDKIERYKNL